MLLKHRKRRLKSNHEKIIVSGYLLIILLGAFLLSLPISSNAHIWTSFEDALFTSTSATCITGLILYDNYLYWSLFGQIVLLVLIQVGGLGFMTFIAMFYVFLRRNIGLSQRLLLVQTAGSLKVSGIVRLVIHISIFTFVMEAIGTLLLSIRFIPEMGLAQGLYNALFLSVSAFCNAGFDLMGRYAPFSSLQHFEGDVLVYVTVMALTVIGGLGFIVWNDIATHKWHLSRYYLHSKIVLTVTFLLTVIPTFLFLLFERNASLSGLSFFDQFWGALFQAITPRTAGFNTEKVTHLSQSGLLLTMILMFIGGNPGSTSGGIKTTTFFVLVMGAYYASRKQNHIQAFKRRLDEESVKEANAIFVLYMSAILVSTLLLCLFQPFSLKDALFEVVSASSTVGLTTGITTSLNGLSKMLIVLLMFTGRVGGLTFALFLAERNRHANVERPVERILIG